MVFPAQNPLSNTWETLSKYLLKIHANSLLPCKIRSAASGIRARVSLGPSLLLPDKAAGYPVLYLWQMLLKDSLKVLAPNRGLWVFFFNNSFYLSVFFFLVMLQESLKNFKLWEKISERERSLCLNLWFIGIPERKRQNKVIIAENFVHIRKTYFFVKLTNHF